MLVNSLTFLLFFTIVLLCYFSILRNHAKAQNVWLLLASYFFYGYVSWEMCGLLALCTIVFYAIGIGIPKLQDKKKYGLTFFGVALGAGLLLYFKYTNFFIEQLSQLFSLFGLKSNWNSLHILVPIGISFFTFKLISYVVEVYKGVILPTRDFVGFALYVSFFPTIMSGPIDRADKFLPQLEKARRWNSFGVLEGCKRILWGMFLKMCIADKVSPYTDAVFNNYFHHSGLTIVVASILYTFQIYADFCGYSEMAIGTAKILGIQVAENFRRPLFATSMGDFWRRWHMSLMSWLRDYIYIPLGGSRCSKVKTFRNTLATFLVSGLWHGANWTFIFWGLYHGMLVFFYRFWKKQSVVHLPKYLAIFLVFIVSTIGWMIFRAWDMGHFFDVLSALGNRGGFFFSWALVAVLPIAIMLFKELKDEEGWNIHLLHAKKWWVQAIWIAVMMVFVFYVGELNGAQFIYFQF